MSASRGDLLAWLGLSCSPVMNKSINRLSLQEEKGGCFQPARSEKALSGLGQAEHRAVCCSEGGRAGCHTAACRHRSERQETAVCLCVCRVWGQGCHVLFWCEAVCYNSDPSGKQSQKDGLNKEQREKRPFPYSLCSCLNCYKHCLTRCLPGCDPALYMRPDPVVKYIQWSRVTTWLKTMGGRRKDPLCSVYFCFFCSVVASILMLWNSQVYFNRGFFSESHDAWRRKIWRELPNLKLGRALATYLRVEM